MKKIILGLLLSVAGFSAASAADLGGPAPSAPLARLPGATYDWTGFYIGVTAGGAWGRFDPRTSTVFSPTGYFAASSVPAVNAAGIQRINPSGFLGGVEGGYNWESNNLVLGLETDYQYVGLRGNSTSGPILYPAFAPSTFTVSSRNSINGIFTLRPRVGLAANNFLFYVTGGLALTDLNGTYGFTDTFAAATEVGNVTNTEAGYVLGGGIEAGLSPEWTVKAEYLYMNFSRTSNTSTNLTSLGVNFPTNVFTHSMDLTANVARVGLNYRF
jgi:outer membrane immunogenic protein